MKLSLLFICIVYSLNLNAQNKGAILLSKYFSYGENKDLMLLEMSRDSSDKSLDYIGIRNYFVDNESNKKEIKHLKIKISNTVGYSFTNIGLLDNENCFIVNINSKSHKIIEFNNNLIKINEGENYFVIKIINETSWSINHLSLTGPNSRKGSIKFEIKNSIFFLAQLENFDSLFINGVYKQSAGGVNKGIFVYSSFEKDLKLAKIQFVPFEIKPIDKKNDDYLPFGTHLISLLYQESTLCNGYLILKIISFNIGDTLLLGSVETKFLLSKPIWGTNSTKQIFFIDFNAPNKPIIKDYKELHLKDIINIKGNIYIDVENIKHKVKDAPKKDGYDYHCFIKNNESMEVIFKIGIKSNKYDFISSKNGIQILDFSKDNIWFLLTGVDSLIVGNRILNIGHSLCVCKFNKLTNQAEIISFADLDNYYDLSFIDINWNAKNLRLVLTLMQEITSGQSNSSKVFEKKQILNTEKVINLKL